MKKVDNKYDNMILILSNEYVSLEDILVKTFAEYGSADDYLIITKGTLENVLTGKKFVNDTDYASTNKGGVIKANEYFNVAVASNGNLRCVNTDYATYQGKDNNSFVSKGTLEAVITGKGLNVKNATGYDATKTQVLKNINGTLTWVNE